jgi:hypothetical protein
MSPFISSVKVIRRNDDRRVSIISVCVLTAILFFYIVFSSWANSRVEAKREEMKALAEQVESFNEV